MKKETTTIKIKVMEYSEMKSFNLEVEQAESFGYIVIPDKVKLCKNCGAKSYKNDFCDSSCAMDYIEE